MYSGKTKATIKVQLSYALLADSGADPAGGDGFHVGGVTVEYGIVVAETLGIAAGEGVGAVGVGGGGVDLRPLVCRVHPVKHDGFGEGGGVCLEGAGEGE